MTITPLTRLSHRPLFAWYSGCACACARVYVYTRAHGVHLRVYLLRWQHLARCART